jgi:hypothetical protein
MNDTLPRSGSSLHGYKSLTAWPVLDCAPIPWDAESIFPIWHGSCSIPFLSYVFFPKPSLFFHRTPHGITSMGSFSASLTRISYFGQICTHPVFVISSGGYRIFQSDQYSSMYCARQMCMRWRGRFLFQSKLSRSPRGGERGDHQKTHLGFLASCRWRHRSAPTLWPSGYGGGLDLGPRRWEGSIFLFLGFKFGGATLRCWRRHLFQ